MMGLSGIEYRPLYAVLCPVIVAVLILVSGKRPNLRESWTIIGSVLLFLRKHKGLLTYSVACLLMAIFFAIRVPYWLVKAMFSKRDRNNHLLTAQTYITGTFRALMGARGLCTGR